VIKELQRSVPEDSMNIGGYIHMKIKIRAAPDGRDFMICQNTKTGRVLVSYAFLANFSDVDIIKVSKFVRIAGYLNPIIKLQEWAIWTYYVPGVRCDGTSGIV